ncbi:MAG: DUF421 domain-containing protein [Erysipelotrichaceae bacterium]|nr:DUF421 domain-containing protein [Erysipelotrichaceae bacterium]
MDILLIFVRTIFFYFFIFIVYRIMGKREVGQLGIIDLIVSILIAELVVISIEDYDNNIFMSVVPILTLLFLQVTLAFLSLRKPKFRIFLDGNPSIMIQDGRVNYKEMTRQKYNLDDLLVQLREKGYRSIEEVEYAILENSGSLSVFPYPKDRKKTPLPLPIILDSQIQEDTLKIMHKDKNWVYQMLEKKNIQIEDVFYAFYKDNNIFIIKDSELI